MFLLSLVDIDVQYARVCAVVFCLFRVHSNALLYFVSWFVFCDKNFNFIIIFAQHALMHSVFFVVVCFGWCTRTDMFTVRYVYIEKDIRQQRRKRKKNGPHPKLTKRRRRLLSTCWVNRVSARFIMGSSDCFFRNFFARFSLNDWNTNINLYLHFCWIV